MTTTPLGTAKLTCCPNVPPASKNEPETFVIDRNGYVVERVIGPREWDSPEQVKALEALISADEAPAAASVEPVPHGPS